DLSKTEGKVLDKKGPLGGTLYELPFGGLLVLPGGKHLIYSFNIRTLKNFSKGDGPLTSVIAQAREKDYAIALGIGLSDKVRARFKEELAEPGGFGPEFFMRRLLMPFVELKSGLVTVSLGDRATAQVTGTFTSAAAAKKGKVAAEDGLTLIRIL